MLTGPSEEPESGEIPEAAGIAAIPREAAETAEFRDVTINVADSTAHVATHFLRFDPVAGDDSVETEPEQPGWAVVSFDRCEGGNLSYGAGKVTRAT